MKYRVRYYVIQRSASLFTLEEFLLGFHSSTSHTQTLFCFTPYSFNYTLYITVHQGSSSDIAAWAYQI